MPPSTVTERSKIVSGSTVNELESALARIDSTARQGSTIMVSLFTQNGMNQEQLISFRDKIRNAGISLKSHIVQTNYDSIYQIDIPLLKVAPSVQATDTKPVGFAWWLVLVPIVAAIGFFGFVTFQLPEIFKAALPLVLAIGGIFIIIVALSRGPATKYIETRR